MCIIHCRATRHECAAKATAGDDPSSPINGNPHPLCSSWPHVTLPCAYRLTLRSYPTTNERLNIHAERFQFLTFVPRTDHQSGLLPRNMPLILLFSPHRHELTVAFLQMYLCKWYLFQLGWQSSYSKILLFKYSERENYFGVSELYRDFFFPSFPLDFIGEKRHIDKTP